MELDKHQFVDNFLSVVRLAKNKNEFLKYVQDFDQKFTQSYPSPSYNNKQSYQSLSSAPQFQPPQKIKNPFLNTTVEENNKRNYSPPRSNNFMPSPQNSFAQKVPQLMGKNQINMPYSQSEHDFYRQQEGSRTYQGGFGQKPYQKPSQKPSYNQFVSKQPQYGWQMNEAYQQPQPYQQAQPYQQSNNYQQPNNYQQSNNYQQANQPYSEINKQLYNMNINQHAKYMNNNQLSVNSHQNLNAIGSALDSQNQYLTGIQNDQEPDFVKYYKRLVPMPKQQILTPKQYNGSRQNPFANH